jgi:predicted RNA binding protein YcfA (HicA-like mRNA interferase family)
VSELPRISGRDAGRAFEKAGYTFDRKRSGHLVYLRQSGRLFQPPRALLSIPDHRELKVGMLRSLIRDAGLTVEGFKALLR